MLQSNHVTIPLLPEPLRWHGEPLHWEQTADRALTITAGPQTDWFTNPSTGTAKLDAPALLMPVHGPCMLSALVGADHTSTFDAGVLAIFQSSQVWAKLCVELSPQGQAMIVTVVTRGLSDDCNSFTIAGHSAYLRLAKLERAYAFHYSPDGTRWDLIRHFALGEAPEVEFGFLAQSPTGKSCTAHFQQIGFRSETLTEIRSGE